MASQIRLYDYAVMEIDGQIYEVGSLRRPRCLAVAGEKEERRVTVETTTTQELWDVDDSHLGDFDFLWIQSDYDVSLEFIVDDDGDVGEVAFTLDVEGTGNANEYGPPLILCSDASYANNTAGFAGTADVIERITVYNANASSAQVYVLVVT